MLSLLFKIMFVIHVTCSSLTVLTGGMSLRPLLCVNFWFCNQNAIFNTYEELQKLQGSTPTDFLLHHLQIIKSSAKKTA